MRYEPCIEGLERRYLLSSSVLVNNEVIVTGDTGTANTIIISENLSPTTVVVELNGTYYSYGQSVAKVIVFGGNANNMIHVQSGEALTGRLSVPVDMIGGSGQDTMIAEAGDDLMIAGSGTTLFEGGAGQDTMIGGAGNSTMLGGHGDDLMIGGAGQAVMIGGGGNNAIFGGAGNDTITGGAVSNELIGGTGVDVITGTGQRDTIYGGNAGDTIIKGSGVEFIHTGALPSRTKILKLVTPVTPKPAHPALPSAPKHPVATASDSAVTLAWSATSNTVSYTVGRSTTSGGSYSTIASGIATTGYVDNTAINGTTYYYVIQAVNATGTGAASAQVQGQPATGVLPAVPGTPSTFSIFEGSNQIVLTWNVQFNATSYTVERATALGGPYTILASGLGVNSYTDATVVNGTIYYYYVQGVNAGGAGTTTTKLAAKPALPALPVAPSGLFAQAGSSQVALSWATTPLATGYTIERSTISGGPYTILASGVTDTNYTDGTAITGTTYYYVIIATNDKGAGLASRQASAMPN